MNRTAVISSALIVLAGVLAASPPPSLSQQRKPTGTPTVRLGQADQYEVTSQISEAMRYLTVDPDRAVAILRSLSERFPGNERVLSRLGYVYQVAGKPDSAEVYFREALRINPQSFESAKSLGMLYLSDGRDAEARRVFDDLLRSSAYSMSAYRAVGSALRDVGRYDEALALYRSGRNRNPRNDVLSLEIADLLKATGDYEGAVAEYLAYTGEAGRNYRHVRTQVLDLLRGLDEPDRARVVASLESRLDSGKGNRFVVLDILAAHYVEQGLLEKALEKALLADKEGPSDGSVLISLAERILAQADARPRSDRRRYLELGVRALDAFATNHPSSPGSDRARYMLATIYEQFGSGEVPGLTVADRVNYLEQAVAEYADISRRYPASQYAERSYLARGDLLLHRLKRPDDALEAYRSGSVNSRVLTDVFAGRIGDVYLGLGRYDDAKEYFERMIDSGYPELVQAGTYYTGLRLSFQGRYEAARDTLTQLAETVPSSPYANDAIDVAWILQEGLLYDSTSLGAWFDAARAELVGDTTTVVANLDSIVAKPVQETLRPRALYKLGCTLYDRGNLDRAVALLEEFLDEYPDEDLRPDVQREIAEIYEFGYEQYDKALREYENVLMTYPDYAFLDEVRSNVRRLRYIVHGEEYEN